MEGHVGGRVSPHVYGAPRLLSTTAPDGLSGTATTRGNTHERDQPAPVAKAPTGTTDHRGVAAARGAGAAMTDAGNKTRPTPVGKAEDWKVDVMNCPALGTVKVFAFARHGGMHVMDLPVGCVPDLIQALKAAVR